TLMSMFTWIEKHSDSIIGYRERAKSFRPVVQEAIRFAIDRSALIISDDGGIWTGPVRVSFTTKIETTLTRDTEDCISATRFLGRWFAKAGTTTTILAAWGIRP